MRERIIGAVTFDEDGCTITYAAATDLKANGLMMNHQLVVPFDEDYDDELEAVLDALHALVDDALEDFGRLDAMPEVEPEPEEGVNDDIE